MLDTFIHRWLRVPYTLKVRYLQRPKKPRATLLFIHGLGNTGEAWNSVVRKMPPDVRIITIDLLGFGQSPSPTWALYDAKTQAKAVLATLLRLRIATPTIVIGHSIGALVAIEMAKRYPLVIDQLILCSPPLYKSKKGRLPRSDDLLRQLYTSAEQHPDRFLRIAAFSMKYKLINDSFNVNDDNIASYMAALRAMILNQTSLDDAYQLTVPTTILRGTLDPFIVAKNLQVLQKSNPHITIKAVIAGHEVRGTYVRALTKVISSKLQDIKHK